jgi:sortase (surface protein transpeptidase)
MSLHRIKHALLLCFLAFFVLIIVQTLLNAEDAGAPASVYVNDLLFFTAIASVLCIPGLVSPKVYGFRMGKPLIVIFFVFFALIISKTYVNIRGSLPELPKLTISFPEFHVPRATADSATAPVSAPISTTTTLTMSIDTVPAGPPRPQAGVPVSLSIPAAKIDAKIEKVGITSSGEMEAPKVPEQAGWYEYGPRPGMDGLAILLGHSGWVRGRAVAFDALHLVKKGEQIYVSDDMGHVHPYRAVSVKKFAYDAPLSTMVGTTTETGIALITCAGDWDKEKHIYKERLVVLATPS